MTKDLGLVEELRRDALMIAVRTGDAESAYRAAAACVEAGVRFVEITFSVPGADEVIRRLRADTAAAVGAGTILGVEDARRALRAGAAYLVSPHLDEELVRFAGKEGVLSIPGASTPTEIHRAHRAGADIVKLFPFVQMGGLGFLAAIRGPLPFVRCLLAGGANLENLPDYLAADPAGILIGAAVIRRDLVAAGDWGAIGALAKRYVDAVAAFRARVPASAPAADRV